jgi:carbonic anhydrase
MKTPDNAPVTQVLETPATNPGMRFPGRLVEGYHDFVVNRLPLESSRFHKLAETGQKPEVMVICCCDSRVSPEVIFDAHPGELFVVRNVANLVPPYSPSGFTHGVSAALEFAVQGLKVSYIMVMGHSHCGGIRAFVEHKGHTDPGDFIDNWMSLITPAAATLGEQSEADRAAYLVKLEKASVVATLDNLKSFPWIRSRVDELRLELIGAYFDVSSGALEIYDPVTGQFSAVVQSQQPATAAE